LDLETIIDDLLDDLKPLRFRAPVTHVYNPLEYARTSHSLYLQKYATPPKEIVLLGMNPGPWGMVQTGVPFGEIKAVKEWLDIETRIGAPAKMHPKRPVTGFKCTRSEVSGRRLWGWAQNTFKTPLRFFSRFFVANYCPLMFIETGGRNRTPNQLRAAELGQFARERVRAALTGADVTIGRITHPSPANPKANRGWESLIKREFQAIGIRLE
jgi:single-strand selective monofunctional uracil DNA glycosylase